MPLCVLVTGANRGIGLEFVRQLLDVRAAGLQDAALSGASATDGRKIFATYRNRADADDLFGLADKSGDAIRPIQLDVSDESSYSRVVDQVSAQLGTGVGLNVLVHNAGKLVRPGDIVSSTKEELMSTYDLNAVAPFLLTRAFLPLLEVSAKIGQGTRCPEFAWSRSSVIFVSALWGSPTFNTQGGIPYAYGMSKAALNFAAKALSLDLKPRNIFTVALHPGWVKTRMGGDQAPIAAVDSVRQMLDVALPSMDMTCTGGFYNYDGRPLKY